MANMVSAGITWRQVKRQSLRYINGNISAVDLKVIVGNGMSKRLAKKANGFIRYTRHFRRQSAKG